MSNSLRDGITGSVLKNTMLPLMVIIICFTLQLSVAHAASRPRNRDPFEFVGVKTAEQAKQFVVDKNEYLIALKRPTTFSETNQTYYCILLKGLTSLEKRVLADAEDGVLDHFETFEAALIAEGILDPAQFKEYQKRIDDVVDKVRARIRSEKLNEVQTAQAVLEQLYSDILTGKFDISNTNPAKVMDTGNFNCVSATLLYNVIAQRVDLTVCGLETIGHVLSRIKIGGSYVNVETTCSTWFQLLTQRERNLATTRRSARTRVLDGERETVTKIPLTVIVESESTTKFLSERDADEDVAKNYREISDRDMIAILFYNQGFDLWQEHRYAEAIAASAKAIHIDPNNETAWSNLLGAINNLAIEFSDDHKRYDIADSLLRQLEQIEPNFKNLDMNHLSVLNQWIRVLGSEGRIDEANQVYKRAEARFPNNAMLRNTIQTARRGDIR